MMTRTRYFVIASLLTLGVGLGVGTLAYYGDSASALSRQGGPDDLRLLPANLSMVAYADMSRIMASPLRERLRTLFPGQQDSQQSFFARTGIDIDRDIDQIVGGFLPPSAGSTGRAIGLVRGRFNEAQIESLLREQDAAPLDYKGKRLIEIASIGLHPGFAVAFVEPGFMAMGDPGLVRGAIDGADGGTGLTTNEPVMNLVRDLDSADAWAVGRFDALTGSALPANVKDRLPSIEWFSVMANVDAGLRGVVKAEAVNEEAAASMRDVVRGVVALARLQTSSNPELTALVQSLELGGSGKTVALAFDLSPTAFDLLGTLANRPRSGARQPIQ